MPIDEIEFDHARANELHRLGLTGGTTPQKLRRRWCSMQVSYPPVWLGTVFMAGAARALHNGTYSTISWWVGVAREFSAVGLTPELYQILRLCISHARGPQPRHPLIHWSNVNAPRPFIRAAAWADWPALLDAGNTPQRATHIVLERALAAR